MRRVLVGCWLGSALLAGCGSASTAPPTPIASPSPSDDVFGHVHVGGYELAYECRGTGTPTIVAEAGYDTGGTTAYAGVLEPLSRISRVCTYDRAGTGNSDPRPPALAKGLTSEDQARELHALLEAARIEGPYVVVGHSYGGFVTRLSAADYPGETVGMVLIESSHEDEIQPYRRYYGNDPEGDWVDGGDLLDIDATAAALRAKARDYGALPLIAMRAEVYEDVLTESLWRRTQADLATLSTDSVAVEALGSGHFVMDDNPDAVVAAVAAVVTAARNVARLPPCEEIFARVQARCL
jgi:pimeloyl-ACP methyl ester carboxylesterase